MSVKSYIFIICFIFFLFVACFFGGYITGGQRQDYHDLQRNTERESEIERLGFDVYHLSRQIEINNIGIKEIERREGRLLDDATVSMDGIIEQTESSTESIQRIDDLTSAGLKILEEYQ